VRVQTTILPRPSMETGQSDLPAQGVMFDLWNTLRLTALSFILYSGLPEDMESAGLRS